MKTAFSIGTRILSLAFALGSFGTARAEDQKHNVFVYFPSPDSPVVEEYKGALEKDYARGGIGKYSESLENGGITFCIEARDAGNQYRVIEFTKNSTSLINGSYVRMRSLPCD